MPRIHKSIRIKILILTGWMIILNSSVWQTQAADPVMTFTRNDAQGIQLEIRIDSFSLDAVGPDQALTIPGSYQLATPNGLIPYLPLNFIIPDIDSLSYSSRATILDSLELSCPSLSTLYDYIPDRQGTRLEKRYRTDTTITYPWWIEDLIKLNGDPIALGRLILARYNPDRKSLTVFKRLALDIRFQSAGGLPRPTDQPAKWNGFVINPGTRFPAGSTSAPSLRKTSPSTATGYLAACKFPIYQNGIHRITYSQAKNVIPNLSSYNFNQFKIMYGGGKPIEEDLTYDRPQFKEVASLTDDNGNLQWDEGESILFYAEAITRCQYSPYPTGISSIFDDQNIYWLVVEASSTRQSIPSLSIPSATLSQPLTTAQEYCYKEQNDIIREASTSTARSGTAWYWSALSETSSSGKSFTVSLQLDEPGPDSATCKLITSSGAARYFRLTVNGQTLNGITSPYTIPSNLLISGENTFTFYYTNTLSSTLYIDNFSLLYQKKLTIAKNTHTFWVPQSSANDGLQISLAADRIGRAFYLFEISDPYLPQRYTFSQSSSSTLNIPTDPPRSYLFYWCQADQVTEVSSLTAVDWKNLQSTDNQATYLIITHQDFNSDAERLAQFYRDRDGITVRVITIDDVYNEFAYGLHDMLAIRDFFYYAGTYWNQTNEKTGYALLFGDGHWDYRGKYADASPIKIPAYETNIWSTGMDSYVMSDDYYGFFLNAYGTAMNRNYPQIAIGRIPVLTKTEAANVVDKIIAFQTRNTDDRWRQKMIISADDEFNIQSPNTHEEMHTINTERVIVPRLPGFALINKIYLMNYSTATKSQARIDLKRNLNEGVLLFNWVGHGSWERLAHETIFQGSEDIPQLTNQNRYFLFYASACDVGRYDLLSGYSMAERILIQPGVGAMASISATRATSMGANENLNALFLDYAINDGYPIGKALIMAKASYSDPSNNRCYNLLGDPYLSLYNIHYQATVTALNTDTLTAGETFTFKARISPINYSVTDAPQGNMMVILQDAPKYVNFTYVDSVQFPGNLLFKGLFEMDSTMIQGNMIMPIDMSYRNGQCELKMYQPGQNEAVGYYNHLYLSGRMSTTQDSLPPQIDFNFDYIPATDGIAIWTTSLMIVDLYDEHGINLTGESGHQILLTVDDDSKSRIDLTSYFQYNVNSCQEGQITYTLSDLSLGSHTLKLRCFDNFNNIAEKSIQILVQTKKPLVLEKIFNYPNPFRTQTQFVFSTNSAGRVTLEIFTLSGRRIMKLEKVAAVGQNILDWNGRDWAGDELAAGTYFYKLDLTDPETGRTIHKTQKMVKIK